MASAAGQFLGFAALGLASIVLGRALGTGGFGTFAIAFSLQAFLVGLASLGLHNGIAYEVATGRWAPGSALRRAFTASILIGGLIAALSVAVCIPLRADLLPGASPAAIVVLLAGIPMGMLLLLLVGTAIALERYEVAGLIQVAQPAAIAVSSSVVAIVFGLSAAVAAVGAAVIAVGLVAAVWAFRLSARLDRENPDLGTQEARLRTAVGFGTRTWASDLLSLVNLRGDLILVGALSSSSQAGLYGVATAITSLGLVAPQALAQVLLPRVAGVDQKPISAEEDSRTTIGRAGRQSVLIAIGSSLLLIVAIALVPALYGSPFDDAVPLGLILIPGVAAFGVSRVLAYALAGLGAPGLVLRLTFSVVVPTVIAFVVAISLLDALGAALVSTVSYSLSLAVIVIALSRRSGVAIGDLLAPRRRDLSAYPELGRMVRQYFLDLTGKHHTRVGTSSSD